MAIQMRPGYINPLTTITDKKAALKWNQPASKRQPDKVTDLQTKQQALQNQMLLLKATGTDSAAASAETQKIVSEELEKVTAELRSAKGSAVQAPAQSRPDTPPVTERPKMDRYEPGQADAASPGFYRIEKDEEEGYRIFFSPHVVKP